MIVTGTSRGIGVGVARHFLGKGYHVEGCSRGAATFEASAYVHTTVDVRDEDHVVAWVRAIERRHGRIDVVVNNAGLAPAATPALMTSGTVLDDVFRTNAIGSYLVAREAARGMVAKKVGRIISVSSMAVGLHEEGTAAYAASKSAIVEFTRIMAKEWATSGVTCNVIAPSMFPTQAVEVLGEAVIARALQKLTVKRTVTMGEVCHVLEFLIHPLGGIITGQVIAMGLVSG
ncbi:MAG: SDR family oxidoreductase [bacterium]|nr:SDR family oxidoreductase [bacterium]